MLLKNLIKKNIVILFIISVSNIFLVQYSQATDISDVILSLQITAGKTLTLVDNVITDINGDEHIGIEESIYALRACAGFETHTQNNNADEMSLIVEMIKGNPDISEVLDHSLLLAIQSVWFASAQNYSIPTFTGTLNQQGEYFYYSNIPTDKLILAFSNGLQVQIYTNASIFTGDAEDELDDFLDDHQIEFDIFIQDGLDLNIKSSTSPAWNCDDDFNHYCVEWNRTIKGEVIVDEERLSVDLNAIGKKMWGDPSGSIVLYKKIEDCQGTILAGSTMINLLDKFTYKTAYNSNTRFEIRNYILEKAFTANSEGLSFQLNNCKIRWDSAATLNSGIANKHVDSPSYWYAGGELYKNGQLFGNIKFDGPVIYDTSGPNVILMLLNGDHFELFKPIDQFLNE